MAVDVELARTASQHGVQLNPFGEQIVGGVEAAPYRLGHRHRVQERVENAERADRPRDLVDSPLEQQRRGVVEADRAQGDSEQVPLEHDVVGSRRVEQALDRPSDRRDRRAVAVGGMAANAATSRLATLSEAGGADTRRVGDLRHRRPLHETVGQHRSEARVGEGLLGELGVAIAGQSDGGQALDRDLRRHALLRPRVATTLALINRLRAGGEWIEGLGRDAVEDRLALPTGARAQRRVGRVEQTFGGAAADPA